TLTQSSVSGGRFRSSVPKLSARNEAQMAPSADGLEVVKINLAIQWAISLPFARPIFKRVELCDLALSTGWRFQYSTVLVPAILPLLVSFLHCILRFLALEQATSFQSKRRFC